MLFLIRRIPFSYERLIGLHFRIRAFRASGLSSYQVAPSPCRSVALRAAKKGQIANNPTSYRGSQSGMLSSETSLVSP
jgi:hypothetical protein